MSKVLTSVVLRTLVITINRPEKRNCVDGETARLLHDAWIRFRDDDALWVAILTGSGDQAFSAGADLSDLGGLSAAVGTTTQQRDAFVQSGPGFLGYTRQTDVYKPIVCAVNGFALAGGLELMCMGDIRVVEEHAEMGVACRRWDVPLVDGGTQRLPRIVGMGRAMELILTGRFIDAAEAKAIGLANEVVCKGAALARAHELAKTLCALPQGAMRADKKAAMLGWGTPLAEGLRIEAAAGMTVLGGADMAEGARAFLEKRSAKFPR